MPINHEVVCTLLEKDVPPSDALKSAIRIQGEFRGQKNAFGISEEVLSKTAFSAAFQHQYLSLSQGNDVYSVSGEPRETLELWSTCIVMALQSPPLLLKLAHITMSTN